VTAFDEMVIKVEVFKNLLNIPEEWKTDKEKVDEIDRIKFFQYCRLHDYVYERFARKMPINEELIAEKRKVLEVELAHIFENEKKLKNFLQNYYIWKYITLETYWDEDELISAEQEMSMILNDFTEEERDYVFGLMVNKWMNRMSLRKTLKKKLGEFIKNSKKPKKGNPSNEVKSRK